jgi:Sporulation and spore germination
VGRGPAGLRAAALASVILAVGACGVPGTGPRSLDVAEGAPGLLDPTTTTVSTTTTTGVGVVITAPTLPDVDVFLVGRDGSLLVQTRAEVTSDLGDDVVDDAEERLRALLEFSFSDLEVTAGYTTKLEPAAARVTGVTDTIAEVDLDRSAFPLGQSDQQLAFAQIVWTLIEADGIHSVRFTIDGEPGRALTWTGTLADFGEPVDRSDYLSAYQGNTPSVVGPAATTEPQAVPTSTATTTLTAGPTATIAPETSSNAGTDEPTSSTLASEP